MTTLLVYIKIKNERGSKYDTAMVRLLLLIFGASVLLIILFASGFHNWVLTFCGSMIEHAPIKYVILYTYII